MNSMKVKLAANIFSSTQLLSQVLSFLLVVGLSQSAPQISQQGLVGQVLGQLQPTIQRIVASAVGSRGSAGSAGLSQRAPAFSQRTPTFSQGSNFGSSGFSQGSSFNQGSSSSSLSASQLTSSVVSSLQPAIASAVADALRSRQSRPVTSSVSALSPEEEASINARQVISTT